MAWNVKDWCRESATDITLVVLSAGHALSTAAYGGAAALDAKPLKLMPALKSAPVDKQIYAGVSGFSAFTVNTGLNIYFIPKALKRFLEMWRQLRAGELGPWRFWGSIVPAVFATFVNTVITYKGLEESPPLAWVISLLSVPQTLATRFKGWDGVMTFVTRWRQGDNRDQLDLMAALDNTNSDYVPRHFQLTQPTESAVCEAWCQAYYKDALDSPQTFRQDTGLTANPFTLKDSARIYLPYYLSVVPVLASLFAMFMVFPANAGVGLSAVINYLFHTSLTGEEPLLAYVFDILLALPNLAFYAYACQLASATMEFNREGLYSRTKSVLWTVGALVLEYGILGVAANSVVGLVEGVVNGGHIENAYHVDSDSDYIRSIIGMARGIGVLVNLHGFFSILSTKVIDSTKGTLPVVKVQENSLRRPGQSAQVFTERSDLTEDEETPLIRRPSHANSVTAARILKYLQGNSLEFKRPLPPTQLTPLHHNRVDETPPRPSPAKETAPLLNRFGCLKEMHVAFRETLTRAAPHVVLPTHNGGSVQ